MKGVHSFYVYETLIFEKTIKGVLVIYVNNQVH